MNNLRVSAKLTIGFSCMILLILIISSGGLYGLFRMGGISIDMYENKAKPLGDLTTAVEYFQRLRVQTRNVIIYTGNLEQLKTVEDDINQRVNQFKVSMQNYRQSLEADDGITLYDDIEKQFREVFEPGIYEVLDGAKRGESGTTLLESMDKTVDSANLIADYLSQLTQTRLDVMRDANGESFRVQNLILIVDIIVILATILIAVILARYISNMISKPLVALSNFMNRAGLTGNTKMTHEDETVINTYAGYKDETGQCISSSFNFIKRVNTISKELQSVSNGDLTIDIAPLSEDDVMGNSVKKMVSDLNNIFKEINTSSSLVSSGSKQIADGSQILAQGSAEQTASVEELSSSIADITQKTMLNAEMASKAAILANTIKQNAEKGSSQMDNMMNAVKEINQASQRINNVIKVIDDIAFQTNILALNAAVEAARAGEAGKGFAVVAEEVRNLAAKSAEAAKDTGGLILNSIEKAELGARIADETAASLGEIVNGINESNHIISEIAESSKGQATEISQLNRGIEQVAQVTQQNNATAEESSAASEEMSSQANVLEELINQFRLRG